ncbi:hypothetical protein [Polaribacter glomeratus]|uniref:Uncharacterized protein n=1 Tax=Polaribacter glomeratus TaxID=102 RepID=A0A2S7WUQ9_9FLAO|nr:hypothetical protein [Polaribacter glomeratus]PQJ81315.1 hypothetical protein BTO16_01410 [Polaribacter glomeratus]TXD64070.1 hypothetical protein ESX12_16570 [Polaribacter glomeratus]
MKKVFKFIGILLLVLFVAVGVYYFVNNEPLPKGKKGIEADALAIKMFNAINHEAYENTEILEWNFRGEHFYKWRKKDGFVIVSWKNNKVFLNTAQPEKSEVFINDEKVQNQVILKQAEDFFNNDSFWLIAPYKIFDAGTERSIVNYKGKDALLITYTSGGSTPGDSYLWILDENYVPTSFKMWTKIIPIGGVSATWSDWNTTASGIKLPTKHTLSLFDMQLDMRSGKGYNPNADALATKVLKAINHEAYKKTRYLEWSFGGKRSFKWDKDNHIVDVSWDTIRVNLQPNNLQKSTVFYNEIAQITANEKIIKRALDIFNNDSFWLVAPHKLFDDGTIRSIKKIDKKDALLIKYTTGGSTPGDSYIWILDENYIPKNYKMFVPSMQMNGVDATWEDWITTESGTLLPTNHTFESGNKLSMGDVKGYN